MAMDLSVALDPSRSFIRDGSVKRVVIKLGTAVVTRADGKVALQRISAVCEQVRELLHEKIEVIVVTSGAHGVGKQMLRSITNIHSFNDPEITQELEGKACASMGQIRLMALYKILFELLGVEAAQFLVTESDFRRDGFKEQINSTVNRLLAKKIVPIFNENDAISARKDPYKDESEKIFLDNDSLAALLAKALDAQLLIMLSDVDGLFTGHPRDSKSRIIHIYLKEMQKDVEFGEKSRVGRGGMEAKVRAASFAAENNIPTVIASGYKMDTIPRIFRGERVGTLFHKDSKQWAPDIETGARELANAAKNAGRRLQSLSGSARQQTLLDIAGALRENEQLIIAANEADKEAARKAYMPSEQLRRLDIKVRDMAESFSTLADMEDPVGKVLQRTELCEGLILEHTYAPVGVVLVIFGSRADAVVQIASLAIRSGNGLLLKGGDEAARTNTILHKVITAALPKSVGPELIGLVTTRDEIPDLLKMDDAIDLVIPDRLTVERVKGATKIPVLGNLDGVCHVFVDKAADVNMAEKVVLDSKLDYPAAGNAMETLLVHEDLVHSKAWETIFCRLQFAGVKMYGGPRAAEKFNLPKATSLHKEYLEKECTVEIVSDVNAAIKHINEYGSSHTDVIVTNDDDTAEIFFQQVDSAAIFRNASSRFCDGTRFGLGAEAGCSTSRIHARGPLGVEGLLTTRWILKGNGHVVNGDRDIAYTHKTLSVANVLPKPFTSAKFASRKIVSNGINDVDA